MLTTEVNKMIGKRARVINSLLNTFHKAVTIDQVLHNGVFPMSVRVIPDGGSPVWLYENDLEVCTCGEGEGCYLCSEKHATPPQSFSEAVDFQSQYDALLMNCEKEKREIEAKYSTPPQSAPQAVYAQRLETLNNADSLETVDGGFRLLVGGMETVSCETDEHTSSVLLNVFNGSQYLTLNFSYPIARRIATQLLDLIDESNRDSK